jgi:glycosyltransferase involved in cell wall biosynthesis
MEKNKTTKKSVVLSIIIPTLNEEKAIKRTLSALVRGIKSINYELIISDGGSTDNTLKIAKKYADRIIENKSGKRQNIAIGRNIGGRAAKGKYLVFLDADVSVPSPEKFFKKVISLFEKQKEFVGIIPRMRVSPNETFADKIVFGIGNIMFYVQNNWLGSGGAAGECQMMRASAFRKLRGYNEKIVVCEDQEMFSRLGKIGKTRLEWSLCVTHTGRRAKKIGWPKLLKQWILNYLSLKLFKKSVTNEWKVVR